MTNALVKNHFIHSITELKTSKLNPWLYSKETYEISHNTKFFRLISLKRDTASYSASHWLTLFIYIPQFHEYSQWNILPDVKDFSVALCIYISSFGVILYYYRSLVPYLNTHISAPKRNGCEKLRLVGYLPNSTVEGHCVVVLFPCVISIIILTFVFVIAIFYWKIID